MSDCRAIEAQLSAFIDGDLEAQERTAVERHLASCAPCRGLAQDLERLRQTASSLGSAAPPDHLWLEVAGRIRLEQNGPVTRLPDAPRSKAVAQWIGLAAALVFVTLATYFVTREPGPARETAVAGNATPADSVQTVADELGAALQHYEKAIAGLEAMAREDGDAVDLALAATLRDSIREIDAAIAESRDAVTADPASEPARESLFEALRRKVSVLQTTVTLMNEMRKGNQAGAAEAAEAFGKKS